MSIIVYSTGCPKCQILCKKLNNKDIPYEICTDTSVIKEKGINSLPVLEWNNALYSFSEANQLINRGDLNES